MKQIKIKDVPQVILDKITQSINTLYSSKPFRYVMTDEGGILCFTDGNNNFIFCNEDADLINDLPNFNGNNIKNSIIIISNDCKTSIDEMNITNSFIYCEKLKLDKNTKIDNCELMTTATVELQNSTVKNSKIITNIGGITIKYSKVDNSNMLSQHYLFIFECSIDNLTLLNPVKNSLSRLNIKDCNFDNLSLIREYASDYLVDFTNTNLTDCSVYLTDSIKIKDITLSNSMLHNDLDITNDIKILIENVTKILYDSKYTEEEVIVFFYIKEDKIMVYNSYGKTIGIFDYKLSNILKQLTNRNTIAIKLYFPYEDAIKDLWYVYNYIQNHINQDVVSSSMNFKNIFNFDGKSYFYDNNDIKEFKDLKFKQTVKQSIIDESVAKRIFYDYYIINKNIYAVKSSNYNIKKNAFMIGQFSELLTSNEILRLQDTTLDAIIDNLTELNFMDIGVLPSIERGNFNIPSNSEFKPTSDQILVFYNGDIFITSEDFYYIFLKNIEMLNKVVKWKNPPLSHKMKNLYDYKKYVKILGEYNKVLKKFTSLQVRDLDFSHNYNYFLTENYVFIIWDVNPENITILENSNI